MQYSDVLSGGSKDADIRYRWSEPLGRGIGDCALSSRPAKCKQDIACSHTARCVLTFLNTPGIRLSAWTADLSSIENIQYWVSERLVHHLSPANMADQV
ncbi:hypothetical protein TNCV_238401 [Trichonephila clavipes]|nr:hypothetical protein TNCV_238401 [Trichonephila clavipes]